MQILPFMQGAPDFWSIAIVGGGGIIIVIPRRPRTVAPAGNTPFRGGRMMRRVVLKEVGNWLWSERFCVSAKFNAVTAQDEMGEDTTFFKLSNSFRNELGQRSPVISFAPPSSRGKSVRPCLLLPWAAALLLRFAIRGFLCFRGKTHFEWPKNGAYHNKGGHHILTLAWWTQ